MFAVIGLEYLVETVSLVLTHDSLARLRAISLHPVLKNRVKSIRISTFMYKAPEDDGIWPYNDFPVHTSDPDFPIKLSALVELSSFQYGQQLVYQKGRFNSCLQAVLASLPRLECLDISEFSCKQLVPSNLKPSEYIQETSPDTYTTIAPQILSAVLSSIGRIPRGQGKRLALTYAYPLPGMEKTDLHLWSAALANLTELNLTCGESALRELYHVDEFHPYLDAIRSDRTFINFLKTAVNLEQLVVDTIPYLDCDMIFDDEFVWHRLKKLSLHRIGWLDGPMLSLLQRHSATLKSLDIGDVVAYPTSVLDYSMDRRLISIFERIKHESQLDLEHFTLDQPNHAFSCDSEETRQRGPPDMIPPVRGLRYLMCGQKTDKHGQEDTLSQCPYDWDAITFRTLRDDVEAFRHADPRRR
ncbi:hypothetical protein MMC10_001633 [Thelotrema lepadinum]|nr:hypothetical protein [Thelotrema lepadinum]